MGENGPIAFAPATTGLRSASARNPAHARGPPRGGRRAECPAARTRGDGDGEAAEREPSSILIEALHEPGLLETPERVAKGGQGPPRAEEDGLRVGQSVPACEAEHRAQDGDRRDRRGLRGERNEATAGCGFHDETNPTRGPEHLSSMCGRFLFYAEFVEDEAHFVGHFLDQLVRGLPRPVPRLALDAEQDRALLRPLRLLHARRHLPRVHRVDP